MSFKEHDKRTFIIDSANAYTTRRISKREFLRRMGLAGLGFSSFGLGMLGGQRRGSRSFGIAEQAYAEGLPDEQAKWLKEVGSKYRGRKVRYTSEATPPTVALNRIKKEFTDLTGIEIEIEIVANALRKGYRILEVSSHERARAGGQVKSRVVRHGTRFLLRIIWEGIRWVPKRPVPAPQG